MDGRHALRCARGWLRGLGISDPLLQDFNKREFYILLTLVFYIVILGIGGRLPVEVRNHR